MDRTCPNCQTELQGKYCHQCGQKQHGRITLGFIFNEFFKHVFDLESPFINTVKGLTIRPGTTCLEYVNGIRKSITSPIQYLIITITVHFIIYYTLDLNYLEMSGMNPQEINGISSATVKSDFDNIGEFIANNIKVLMLMYIPIYAFFTSIFFKRKAYNYAENLILATYLQAHSYVYQIPLLMLLLIDNSLMLVLVVVDFLYFTWGVIQFFRSNLFVGIIKCIIITIVSYFFTYVIFGIIASLLYSYLHHIL